MVDELKPVDKIQLTDRVKFGERYLRDCVDKIAGKDILPKKRKLKKQKEADEATEEEMRSPYDNLKVPKEKPHDLDESI